MHTGTARLAAGSNIFQYEIARGARLNVLERPVNVRRQRDTDYSSAPTCDLGHVLRDIIWRTLYLRHRLGRRARIVLRKMDVKDAFRQVPGEITRAHVFGYVFGGLVVVDRPLQFGWRNSPCNLVGATVQGFGVCLRRR